MRMAQSAMNVPTLNQRDRTIVCAAPAWPPSDQAKNCHAASSAAAITIVVVTAIDPLSPRKRWPSPETAAAMPGASTMKIAAISWKVTPLLP